MPSAGGEEEPLAELIARLLTWRTAREPDPDDTRLGLAALHRIAAGRAVGTTDLVAVARELGLHDPAGHVDRVTACAETDTASTVTGVCGLSLAPTAYRLALRDGDRGTWCALDTLFLPVLLEQAADVAGVCAATGQPVSFRVTAEGEVRGAQPPGLLVSVPLPDPEAPPRSHAALRTTFCAHSRFAVDAEAARAVAGDDAAVRWLDLDDAATLGREIAAGIRARAV